MSLSVPKVAFLALAAVAWADGRLQRTEGTGLIHAARNCGLEESEISEIEEATSKQISLDDLNVDGLSEADAVVTYALACWLARLDGVVTTDEHKSLAALGEKIGLRDALRVRASAVALDIAMLPEGGRPDRYDFAALAERLKTRLPQVEWSPSALRILHLRCAGTAPKLRANVLAFRKPLWLAQLTPTPKRPEIASFKVPWSSFPSAAKEAHPSGK